MAQRIFNISKWLLLREGEALPFENPKARMVVLQVNTPQEVAFYVTQSWDDILSNPEWVMDREAGRQRGDREQLAPGSLDSADGRLLTFVGLVKGRDVLEFAVDGAFELMCEGGPAYVYTVDGMDTETKIVAPYIYTRIANRRQRNPHLEMIEYQMKLNQNAMQERLELEMERRLAAIEKGLERHAPQRNERAPDERVGRSLPARAGAVPPEPEGPDEPAGDGGGKPKAEQSGGSGKRRSVKAPALDPGEDDD